MNSGKLNAASPDADNPASSSSESTIPGPNGVRVKGGSPGGKPKPRPSRRDDVRATGGGGDDANRRRRAQSAGPAIRAAGTNDTSKSNQPAFSVNVNPDWKGFKASSDDRSRSSTEERRNRPANKMAIERPNGGSTRDDPRARPINRTDNGRSKSVGPPQRRQNNLSMEPQPPSPRRKAPMRTRSADGDFGETPIKPIMLSGASMEVKGRAPPRRNASDDRSVRSAEGSNNLLMGLRANLRDNNTTVRQKRNVLASKKQEAAGPTPWRQRMQEEKAALERKQQPSPATEPAPRAAALQRRKSFGGFAGGFSGAAKGPPPEVGKNADSDKKPTRKMEDLINARGRGRTMRNDAKQEERGPFRRRGVSLGRHPSPTINRDDDGGRGKRSTTPFRRGRGPDAEDEKKAPERGRAAPPPGRGRSRTPGPATRQRQEDPKKAEREEAPSTKPSMILKKRNGAPASPTPGQRPSMKLSRDAAPRTPNKPIAGAKNKMDGTPANNKGGGDGRRKKLGKFFGKDGKKAKKGEGDDPDMFSIEDDTPQDGKPRPKRPVQSQKKVKKKDVESRAPQSPTRLFRTKAEFAPPRRAKSMPLEEPDSPFSMKDNPFKQEGKDGEELNFVGVDDESSSEDDSGESSGSDDDSSSGESGSDDSEGSSEEDDSSDDDDDDDDESGSEDPDTKDETTGGSELEAAPVEAGVVEDVVFDDPLSHAKGTMPKRKSPSGKPDDDGFCPHCGQMWPGWDKWSNLLG